MMEVRSRCEHHLGPLVSYPCHSTLKIFISDVIAAQRSGVLQLSHLCPGLGSRTMRMLIALTGIQS